jgi:hypothetical protein
MTAYLTYDVSREPHLVKSKMQELGYMDTWVDQSGVQYCLPSQSLWTHKAEDLQSSVRELQRAISQINASFPEGKEQIVLQRCMAVAAVPWFGIPGFPHQSEPRS